MHNTSQDSAGEGVSISGHVQWEPGWQHWGAEPSPGKNGKVIGLEKGRGAPVGPGKALVGCRAWLKPRKNQNVGLDGMNGTLFFTMNQENIWRTTGSRLTLYIPEGVLILLTPLKARHHI